MRLAAAVRVNNIRYVTSTKIGEWERDKLCRFALLSGDSEPILWDFGSAATHHRLYCDWLPQENWLRNLELEISLDYLATGIPKAGDRFGDEVFITGASPWSLSILFIVPIAPLRP